MDPYLTEENSIRYVPINQRHLSRTLKEHCFRNKLKGPNDLSIADEMTKIVHHLKVRASYRVPLQTDNPTSRRSLERLTELE